MGYAKIGQKPVELRQGGKAFNRGGLLARRGVVIIVYGCSSRGVAAIIY
jgi:hypothetical protein